MKSFLLFWMRHLLATSVAIIGGLVITTAFVWALSHIVPAPTGDHGSGFILLLSGITALVLMGLSLATGGLLWTITLKRLGLFPLRYPEGKRDLYWLSGILTPLGVFLAWLASRYTGDGFIYLLVIFFLVIILVTSLALAWFNRTRQASAADDLGSDETLAISKAEQA